MPDGLYERDILLWSEAQADLLRRLAAGERVNAAIDWSNLIDEVEDLGRSEFNALRSLLQQALTHLLKQQAWPQSRSVQHWRAETIAFLGRAEDRFSPSMGSLVDLERLYQRALETVNEEADESGAPLPLPQTCPFSLDDLLRRDRAALWPNHEKGG